MTKEEIEKLIGEDEGLQKHLQSETDKRAQEIMEKSDNKKISELTAQVDKLTALMNTSTRAQLVTAALEKAGLDTGFSDFIKGVSPESISESVKLLKDTISGEKQKQNDGILEGGEVPPSGEKGGVSTVGKDAAVEYAKNLNVKEGKSNE